MPLAAGLLREVVRIETPTETRNEMGESVLTWSTFTTRRAYVEPISSFELERRGQVGGMTSYTVRLRYVPGLTTAMRLVWTSRENRVLYVSSIIESGHREEHELTCEEQAA